MDAPNTEEKVSILLIQTLKLVGESILQIAQGFYRGTVLCKGHGMEGDGLVLLS